MAVLGTALPGTDCNGVEAPVVFIEKGGRRVLTVEVLRSEGSCGSMEMALSF